MIPDWAVIFFASAPTPHPHSRPSPFPASFPPASLSLVSGWWSQCLVLWMRRKSEVPCATGVCTSNNPRQGKNKHTHTHARAHTHTHTQSTHTHTHTKHTHTHTHHYHYVPLLPPLPLPLVWILEVNKLLLAVSVAINELFDLLEGRPTPYFAGLGVFLSASK